MLLLTILVGLFVINHLKQNTKTSIMIGGNFSLTDQNGKIFNSKSLKKKKKNFFILVTHLALMYVHLIY